MSTGTAVPGSRGPPYKRKRSHTNDTLREFLSKNKDEIQVNSISITELDVSGVTDMSRLFSGWHLFNQPLKWDTSSVINMESTFDGCRSFNQPLEWDTSSVINMESTFDGCSSLNQPLAWDTRSVEKMQYMFRDCVRFNQPLKWNTGSVKNMKHMFMGSSSFNQPLAWDTRNVVDMKYMFSDCVRFNQPLKWNTGSVKNMEHMFDTCTAFNQSLVWDTRNVTDMTSMFSSCSALTSTLFFAMRSVSADGKHRMLEGCGTGATVADISDDLIDGGFSVDDIRGLELIDPHRTSFDGTNDTPDLKWATENITEKRLAQMSRVLRSTRIRAIAAETAVVAEREKADEIVEFEVSIQQQNDPRFLVLGPPVHSFTVMMDKAVTFVKQFYSQSFGLMRTGPLQTIEMELFNWQCRMQDATQVIAPTVRPVYGDVIAVPAHFNHFQPNGAGGTNTKLVIYAGTDVGEKYALKVGEVDKKQVAALITLLRGNSGFQWRRK